MERSKIQQLADRAEVVSDEHEAVLIAIDTRAKELTQKGNPGLAKARVTMDRADISLAIQQEAWADTTDQVAAYAKQVYGLAAMVAELWREWEAADKIQPGPDMAMMMAVHRRLESLSELIPLDDLPDQDRDTIEEMQQYAYRTGQDSDSIQDGEA